MRKTEEKEIFLQNLRDAGCDASEADRICGLYTAEKHAETLKRLNLQRCVLIEEMHESQRMIDRLDHLIRQEEKRKEGRK